MGKISDPKVDRLFGGQIPQGQTPQLVVAHPINDYQVIACLAALLSSWKPKPDQAVGHALELLAESVIQFGAQGEGFKAALEAAHRRKMLDGVRVMPSQ